MRENKKLKFLMIVVILLAIILCFSLSLCHNADNNNKRLDNDENAVQWNGKQTLPTGNGEIAKAIEIPGFNELTFVANQTIQQVNFYNPENNDCYFQVNNPDLKKSELAKLLLISLSLETKTTLCENI